MRTRIAVTALCGSLAACSARAPTRNLAAAAASHAKASPSSSASASAAHAGSPGTAAGSSSAEPASEPSAPSRTTLVLSNEPGRTITVHFDSAACARDEPTQLEIVISHDQRVINTFTIATNNAPAACADYGRKVEVGDYNFDGNEDLAVPVDNAGSYGAPTYAILLFRASDGDHVEAPRLSALTRENLGLFQVDPKHRRLIVNNKSGCCIHYQEELSVRGDVPSVVSSQSESIIFDEHDCHVLLEQTLANGKTRTSKRPCDKSERP